MVLRAESDGRTYMRRKGCRITKSLSVTVRKALRDGLAVWKDTRGGRFAWCGFDSHRPTILYNV